MADRKISDLADGAPAVGTDQVPIARAGTTLRVTLANLQALASVTSNELSAASAQAASAIASEVSNRTSADAALAVAVNVVSNALSVETAARIAAVNTVSDAVSVETAARVVAVNTVSNAVSAAEAALSTKINTVSNAVSALVVAHDALSNRVSANSGTGGAASVTSAELDVVSNAVSVLTVNLNKVKKLVDAFTVSTAALADISGMIMTVTAGDLVEMNAAMFVRYTSTAAAAVGFGLTFPGMVQGGGIIEGMVSITASNLWAGSTLAVRAWFNEEASGSIVLSLAPGISASATRNLPVFYRATFLVSTSGTVNLQARSSSALTTSAPVIQPGSYMRLVKLA